MQTSPPIKGACVQFLVISSFLVSVGVSFAAGPPADKPYVSHIGVVAPDVIVVKIRDGYVRYGRQVPYSKDPGDTIESPDPSTHIPHRWIKRNGRIIGALVGPDNNLRQTFDTLVGGRFDMGWSDKPTAYEITSANDRNFFRSVNPTNVFRKSIPTDIARLDAYWTVAAAREHTLYLKLPRALTPRSKYWIRFKGDRFPAQTLDFDPRRIRSEAVHVSQIGFRPDDPAKVAFLSTWMGTGGALKYRDGREFQVIGYKTGNVVFSGESILSKAASDETEDAFNRNYNGTDVYLLDFSALKASGTYRVCVGAIGCSYPFKISDDVWEKAFIVSARGLYHQRSGIALGPPYTSYKRPRAFHSDDGMTIYRARTPLIDTFNEGQEDPGRAFKLLRETITDETVSNAWGGWMDAGDWDRKITHLSATRYLLDLAQLFPDVFQRVSLNIPESGNQLPDIVDEALFSLDFYRRLQAKDGGVSGGIESFQHPRYGEASWQESLTVAAFAPGVWSSYVYAAVAAQAAHYLKDLRPKRARGYRDTAIRAMRWAEKNFPKRKYNRMVADTRNVAAAELYRLTGDGEWHKLFLKTTVFHSSTKNLSEWGKHEQSEAAWTYARITHSGVDKKVQKNAENALIREADSRVVQGRKTAFRWTKFPQFPPFLFPVPQGVELLRAHSLTGKQKYLTALVLSTQFGAGANPMNLVFTTGLGHKSPKNPLQIDHRISHQPVPPGLTLYGPVPHAFTPLTAPFKPLIKPYLVPDEYEDWPGVESYWDVYWFVGMNEYTIHQTIAPNLYVWGYLAGRGEITSSR